MCIKSPWRSIASLTAAVSLFTACVENGYDLSDLDTDHLFVGDHWTLPLGTAVISAAEILDINNIDELSADANGDYVARYSGVIDAAVKEPPTVKDKSFSLPALTVSVPALDGSSPTGTSVPIPEASLEVSFDGKNVENIRRAELVTDASTSLMRISMSTRGFTLNGATVTADIELPSGFEFDERYATSGLTVDGASLKWSFTLNGQTEVSTVIPVKVIDINGGALVKVSGDIEIHPGTSTSGGTGGVVFGLSFYNLKHTVIYGEFSDLDFDLSETRVSLGGLYDIFEGENTVLAFRDPHIIMNASTQLGIPVVASLVITPDLGGNPVEVDDIVVPAAPYLGGVSSDAIWIGEYAPAGTAYTFAKAPGLAAAIAGSREYLELAGIGVIGDQTGNVFYPAGGKTELDYTVEIPFAPAKGFYAVTTQVISDAFDGDIVDYLFQGGTAEIYGTVTNSLPLRFELEMIITDYNGNPVGITFPKQDIAAPVSSAEPSVSKVSFAFSENDMDKMTNAADINLRFISSGIDDAPALNTADELLLKLKISKTGGIHISSDDDE